MQDLELIPLQSALHDVLCQIQVVVNTISPGLEITDDEREGCFTILMDCVETLIAIDQKIEASKTPVNRLVLNGKVFKMPDISTGTGTPGEILQQEAA